MDRNNIILKIKYGITVEARESLVDRNLNSAVIFFFALVEARESLVDRNISLPAYIPD